MTTTYRVWAAAGVMAALGGCGLVRFFDSDEEQRQVKADLRACQDRYQETLTRLKACQDELAAAQKRQAALAAEVSRLHQALAEAQAKPASTAPSPAASTQTKRTRESWPTRD